MKMLLVGAGAVGESILRILEARDPQGKWLESVVVSDYSLDRAKEVVNNLKIPGKYKAEFIDAHNVTSMVDLIKKYECDFVMDAAAPFVSNQIFDAAYEAGVNYACMGTWSVPKVPPVYGIGLENSFDETMTFYPLSKNEEWRKKGNLACICLGIDPGVVDVFAKFAAVHLFDELKEVHVKDGGNLQVPTADEEDITFGFNVWTVLDECMNPNVEWDKNIGYIVDKPFAGEEYFEMPMGIGMNKLVKIEHEETVLMPRFLQEYGLEKCSFKIALDENLMKALNVIEALGLRGLEKVNINGNEVIPRDIVAACAPQPKDIGDEMIGKMCVGVHCIGLKNGKKREIFMYQPFDNQESMERWGMQAVVAQTGFGAAVGVELIGKGIWKDEGVFAPEHFDPIPYLQIMDEAGFEYDLIEMDSEYKRELDKEQMKKIFEEARVK